MRNRENERETRGIRNREREKVTVRMRNMEIRDEEQN